MSELHLRSTASNSLIGVAVKTFNWHRSMAYGLGCGKLFKWSSFTLIQL